MSLRKLLQIAFVLSVLFLASCTKEPVTVKQEMINGFSVIKFGPLCKVERIEAAYIRKDWRTFYLKPGNVKIVVSYPGEIIGDMVYYTDEPVEILLPVEPGHTYELSGEPAYPSAFKVKIVDKEEGRTIFSEPVELKIKWILRIEYRPDL